MYISDLADIESYKIFGLEQHVIFKYSMDPFLHKVQKIGRYNIFPCIKFQTIGLAIYLLDYSPFFTAIYNYARKHFVGQAH